MHLQKIIVAPADTGPQGLHRQSKTLHDSIIKLPTRPVASQHFRVLTSPSHYASAQKDGVLKLNVEKESSQRFELELLAATYREVARPITTDDCGPLSLSIGLQVQSNPDSILEIVSAEIGANPSCSCEIVKAAITVDELSPEQVAAVVEAAVTASPEHMRLISQCAIASSPKSLAAVQAVIARLDPNAGDSSAKSSKSAKGAKNAHAQSDALVDSTSSSTSDSSLSNPLDMPSYVVPPPPVIAPPSLSNVNP